MLLMEERFQQFDTLTNSIVTAISYQVIWSRPANLNPIFVVAGLGALPDIVIFAE
jgi:hypothetical protein